jgi:hypothetical protein
MLRLRDVTSLPASGSLFITFATFIRRNLVYFSNNSNNSDNKLFWNADDHLIHVNHLRKSGLQTMFLMITVALATLISLFRSPWQQIVAKLYDSVSRAQSIRGYSDRKLGKYRNIRRKSRGETPLKNSVHQYTRVNAGQSKKTLISSALKKVVKCMQIVQYRKL